MQEFQCTNRTCGEITSSDGPCLACGSNVEPIGGSQGTPNVKPILIILGGVAIITGAVMFLPRLFSGDPIGDDGIEAVDGTPLDLPSAEWRGLRINFWNDPDPCHPELEVMNPDSIGDDGHFEAFRLMIDDTALLFHPTASNPKQGFDFTPFDLKQLKNMTVEAKIDGNWLQYPALYYTAKECPNKPLTPAEMDELEQRVASTMDDYMDSWRTAAPAKRRKAYNLFLSVKSIRFPDGQVSNGSNWQSYYQLRYPKKKFSVRFDIDKFGVIQEIQFS